MSFADSDYRIIIIEENYNISTVQIIKIQFSLKYLARFKLEAAETLLHNVAWNLQAAIIPFDVLCGQASSIISHVVALGRSGR